ncbi:hypothetical protein GCM10023170_092400 [Phytohabitans houttuyneae]|uniref:Uncharacterized protein n=1 Tax=Phytohabitans houttuyneae TaxID=1076126 RepID=A0A6V8K6D7_9ACTN|nr:hypothetical protein Phou_014970 [Phytohabitans houttuyneae]
MTASSPDGPTVHHNGHPHTPPSAAGGFHTSCNPTATYQTPPTHRLTNPKRRVGQTHDPYNETQDVSNVNLRQHHEPPT